MSLLMLFIFVLFALIWIITVPLKIEQNVRLWSWTLNNITRLFSKVGGEQYKLHFSDHCRRESKIC